MQGGPAPTPKQILRTLLWGAFLASSWTWCIGMFLPALLVRDYGGWSFAVFATPNVVGAALFGWVMRRPATQGRFLARHRHACMAFGWVTIGFHVFFLAWLSRGVIPTAHLGVAIGIAAMILLAPGRARTGRAIVGALALVLSAGLLLTLHDRTGGFGAAPDGLWRTGAGQGLALALLSPLVVLGFALCPYLDLTFHLARSEAPGRAGTWAFIVGFGAMFLGMIVGTLVYTTVILAWLAGSPPTGTIAGLLAIHLVLQAGVTIGFHGRSLVEAGAWATPAGRVATAIAASVAAVVALAGLGWASPGTGGANAGLTFFGVTIAGGAMSAQEVVYRCFMGFYGLVFPAYVLIVGTLAPDAGWRERRRRTLVWALAVGVCAPMAWMAFIERMEAWSVIAAAILGLVALGAWRFSRPRSR